MENDMHESSHLSWWEKLIGAIVGLWMGIYKFANDYISHNKGLEEFCFMIMDAILIAAFCAVVSGILSFLTRRFCDRYFPNVFKKKE